VGWSVAFFNRCEQLARPEIRVNFATEIIKIGSIGGWTNRKLGDLLTIWNRLTRSDIWKIGCVVQTTVYGKFIGSKCSIVLSKILNNFDL
jgi:hypothetical protein